MFSQLLLPIGPSNATVAGLIASVSAAIAYADGLETARITVTYDGGAILLGGVADSRQAIERANALARQIAGGRIRSAIRMQAEAGA